MKRSNNTERVKMMGVKGKTLGFSINKFYRGIRLYFQNRSYSAWVLLFRHFARRILGKKIPELITIGITNRCQCKCIHCSANIPKQEQIIELDAGEIKRIIDEGRKLGVIRVTFFGGEPLLHKDIFDLVHFAHQSGMITKVNTNGMLLNKEVIAKLKESGLTLCDVSLDDPIPEMHDQLRGMKGLFRQVIEGIKLLKGYGIPCQIVTYASKRNIPSGLKQIITLGKELDVLGVSIVFPMATGCWYDSKEKLLNDEEKRVVMDLGNASFVNVEIPDENAKCNVLKAKSIYISPGGEVTPCPFMPFAFGSIFEEKLETIWERMKKEVQIDFAGDCPMNNFQIREKILRESSAHLLEK